MLSLRRCREPRVHEVVVAISLVDEAPTIAAHGDETGLGTVDQVWEMAEMAIAARYLRYRRPGAPVGACRRHPPTRLFAQAQTITAILPGRSGGMLVTVRRVRHQLRDTLAIMWEATAGQHHTAPCVDRLAIGKQRAVDPFFAQQQTAGRFLGQQCHATIKVAAQQARNQRGL